MISSIADFHFTPTKKATEHLLNEGYSENIYQVGNTVIDALLLGIDEIKMKSERIFFDYFNFIDFSNKIILVTAHRRENLGEPLENICDAINYLNQKYDDLTFVFPVHLNPAVRKTVNEKLSGKQNIHLLAPLDYPKLIWLLNKSFLVITDSGGIQEEAPTLGKPILVIRDITERPEGIDAGNAILVGSNKDNIITNFERIYLNNQEYNRISNISNPYGDGTSSKKIFDIICQNL
jgi:UDP-N-acetylglucosamine 2-epimerase (non-hydrolysing)